MSSYDVVVIGAGPSGLAAARSAAAEGAKTLILEMRAAVGPHSSFPVVIPTSLSKGISNVNRLSEFSLHSRTRTVQARTSGMVVVDGLEFIRNLSKEATAAGVEIWINAPVKDFLKKGDEISGVRARGSGWAEDIRASVVIDASGSTGSWSNLFLRELLSKKWGRENQIFITEYLVTDGGSTPGFYFNPYLAPGGYGWFIPGVSGTASVGIRGSKIHPDTALDEFFGKIVPQLDISSPIALLRRTFSSSGPLSKTVCDGALVTGTAAGQVSPLSVGSLRYSMGCGDLAGKVAAESISEGGVGSGQLFEYDSLWREEFGRELEHYSTLYRALSFLRDRGWDALLEILDGNRRIATAFLDLLLAKEPPKAFKVIFKNASLKDHLKITTSEL